MDKSSKAFGEMSEERREMLRRDYCQVMSVQQSVPLRTYYNAGRLMFQQACSYISEGEWDMAYVCLKKLSTLCLQVIPLHHAYNQSMYSKEKAWLIQHARLAMDLLQNVVENMEREEEEMMVSYAADNEVFQSSRHKCPSDTLATSLEARLHALRVHSSQTSTPAAAIGEASKTGLIISTARQSALEALRIHPDETPPPKVASYPQVGKASWMKDDAPGSLPTHGILMKRSSSLQNLVGGLRKVIIPSNLVTSFMKIAHANTIKLPSGIETCGVLAGRIRQAQLEITTLIIPKQEGSSDMCSMTNEEELFDYCISEEILTLGWIHTHPSQSCFLSSVDLHTHCGFQSILPEAIAIVVAPKDTQKSVGVFRLTTPRGLQLIQNCTLTGFHPHTNAIEIYSDAMACQWDEKQTCKVVDLR